MQTEDYDKTNIFLDFENVAKDIDWSNAVSLIKTEGFYVFGGRDKDNVASDSLVCINVSKFVSTKGEHTAGEPCLKITKPITIGQSPPARFMHSMEFYKDKSLLIIAGGRNDRSE